MCVRMVKRTALDLGNLLKVSRSMRVHNLPRDVVFHNSSIQSQISELIGAFYVIPVHFSFSLFPCPHTLFSFPLSPYTETIT